MPDSTNAGVLRAVYPERSERTQNDTAYEFFRSLFKPLKLQGLKAPFEALVIVGLKGPTPFLKFTPPYWDTTTSWSSAHETCRVLYNHGLCAHRGSA